MSTSTHDTDVVVVGAGLAGLRCAAALVDAGHGVVVLDRSDAVGGRIRTDRVDGFSLDRGFQLLNPAYDACRRWVDLDALALQPFEAGVAARHEHGLARLGHPLAAPRLLPSSAVAGLRRPRELLAVARWLAPLLRARPGTPLAETVTRAPGGSLQEALDAAGVHGLLRGVLDRFLAGVVLEDEGSTAQAYALLLLATFLRGTPGLPERGMQALPAQLARPIGDRVRLHVEVDALEPSADAVLVHTAVGTWRARQVVVAVDAAASRGLLGDLAPADTPGTKGVVTCWFAADTQRRTTRARCSSTRDGVRPGRWSTPPSCPTRRRRTPLAVVTSCRPPPCSARAVRRRATTTYAATPATSSAPTRRAGSSWCATRCRTPCRTRALPSCCARSCASPTASSSPATTGTPPRSRVRW